MKEDIEKIKSFNDKEFNILFKKIKVNKNNNINIYNNNIIEEEQNEFNSIENRNKDNKNKWIINNEEISTFKQDNALTNKMRISKLLKKDDELTLFEIMDEPAMINLDIEIEYPEINKIIFTQEELDGENEKNLNDLLKLPEYMIGEWKNENENEKKNLNKAYTPQKLVGKNPIFTKKINNNNIEGKNINLNKLNLKNLNIYQAKNKNNKYFKVNNNLKLKNEDFNENNNNNKNFENNDENKIRIHKNNLKYISNINENINNQPHVFIKKKPVNSSMNQKNKIEDDINNINNEE